LASLPPSLVPGMSGDERVRVFRRALDIQGAFEGLEVDAYVVTTERYLILMDTMLCPDDAAAMMRQVSDSLAGRMVLCVNSHADWDHAWGNAYFRGEHGSAHAPIIAHDYCRVRMQSEQARQELEEFRRLDPLFRQVELVPPTMTFAEHLTIDGGDLTIELLAAPGHQLDELAAWIPDLHLLLAFDAVEYPFPSINGPEAVPLMFSTLERLSALAPRRILCSHGNSTDPLLVRSNLAYLQEIERRGRAYLSSLDGKLPEEQDLSHGSQLISYPFDEVIAGHTGKIDRTYYSQAHEDNIAAVLRWLVR
jgi:glyoxylase-like metal-dependent hydrolase (beta-lactamase superfamily II)